MKIVKITKEILEINDPVRVIFTDRYNKHAGKTGVLLRISLANFGSNYIVKLDESEDIVGFYKEELAYNGKDQNG